MAQPPLVAQYATYISVSFALVAFLFAVVMDLKNKTSSGLESHLAKAGAAGAIPTALLLIYGAFDPSVIAHLTGLNVPLAAAGMALLYISARAILK